MKSDAFAIWLTGLPASGKTTLANLLARELSQRNLRVQVLDSDRLREVLTPNPAYTSEERDWFYFVLAFIGKLLVQNGVNTIIAATAHRRVYRLRAREHLPELIEIFVRCPVKICMARDQKGIYKKALSGEASHVPGVQELYEEAEMPALIVDTEQNSPLEGTQKIVGRLVDFGHISGSRKLMTETL